MIDTAALRKKWPSHMSSITAECVGCVLHAALDEIDRLRGEAHTSSVMVGSPPVRVIADPERAVKAYCALLEKNHVVAEHIRAGRMLVVEPDVSTCLTCGKETP